MTLYRLVGFPALAKVIREKYSEFTEERVMVGERRSVLYWGRTPDKPVKWADTVAGLSGVSVELATGVAAAVLVIPGSDNDEVEANFAWGVTFGMGFHLLDQRYIDSGFGQKIAIRSADPARLNSITKVTLDESAKTDRSSIPVGASLRSFGFEDIGELATRVVASGIIDGIGLGGKPVMIRGADALSLPLSKQPSEFLADLDRLVEILDQEPASDELADLERLVLIKDKSLIETLDDALVDAIDAEVPNRLSIAWPHEAVDEFGLAQGFKVTGAGYKEITDGLPTLADLLEPVKKAERKTWNKRLNEVAVLLYESADPNGLVSPRMPVRKWLTFEVESNDRRYFLHSGRWYLMDRSYADTVADRTREIFSRPAPISTPPKWGSGIDEAAYNEQIAASLGGLLLDKKLINGETRKGKFEACDVLLKDGTFIHVKHVSSSAPASHLLAQALVSTEVLTHDKKARTDLRRRIREAGGDPRDYECKPKKVVVVLAKEKSVVDATNLFTFTQVNLGRQDRLLKSRGVDLSIVSVLKRVRNHSDSAFRSIHPLVDHRAALSQSVRVRTLLAERTIFDHQPSGAFPRSPRIPVFDVPRRAGPNTGGSVDRRGPTICLS
ncbi:hypothetical protein A5789_28045 [Nocardia sp. 852002-51101_SCH5132738]|nr:hypothetical protein A5789_28045 [Nocardia sp. 852002-51101_SCH5132738]OBB52132.1 hypothetical protein A5748_15745 [Nocardia sp. 852002-51244_SCH5132740]OBF72673.1 hypothetical protein A9X06_28155 [Mycobacterium sp. 852002-51759_SCH5129042]